jgi:hypothetical protein
LEWPSTSLLKLQPQNSPSSVTLAASISNPKWKKMEVAWYSEEELDFIINYRMGDESNEE